MLGDPRPVVYAGACSMERNERLLRRVVEERSRRAHIVGIPSEWVLPAVVVGIVAAAAAGFILVRLGSPSVVQQATDDVVFETPTPKPAERTAERTTTSARRAPRAI